MTIYRIPGYFLTAVLLWTGLSFCTSSSPSADGETVIPATNTQLPSTLNLRDNLLRMRGITPDFTQSQWEQSGLNRLQTWQPQAGYYLLGSLHNGQPQVTSLLILADSPAESNAWIVNYRDQVIQDHLLVFHQNDLQNRTVGSDWQNGTLRIRLRKGAERFTETFAIDERGTFQPVNRVE